MLVRGAGGWGRTGRVFATRNSLARLPRFLTTRRKYHPQKMVKTAPKAFCSGVASSSGTPMPSYPSYAQAAVSYAALVSTVPRRRISGWIPDRSSVAVSGTAGTSSPRRGVAARDAHLARVRAGACADPIPGGAWTRARVTRDRGTTATARRTHRTSRRAAPCQATLTELTRDAIAPRVSGRPARA